MTCKFRHEDCKNDGIECDLCFTDGPGGYYVKEKARKRKGLARRQQKADKRAGSSFEFKNHELNKVMLADTVTSMTLNSGATVLEKGDEQIRGLINIMEEDKTRTVEQAPGKKTFTIQKKWLDKLLKESGAEDMEFHYLKFSFHEFDNDIYVITELDQIQSMVKTMVTDRRKAKDFDYRIQLEQKKNQALMAENSALRAKIAYLEKEEEYNKFLDKNEDTV